MLPPTLRPIILLVVVIIFAACQPQVVTPDPAIEVRRQQERATLPAVTTIQKWTQVATISKLDNSTPSILPLIEGDYRIYWTAPSLNGIGSGTTPDGLLFNVDEGARLINAPAGQPDCTISKPWVVQVANGYRMYYEGQAEPCNVNPPTSLTPGTRIFSAFSADGRAFTREAGARIEIGAASGLIAAGHGRVIQKDDGSYRLYFTALREGQENVPVILSATSFDGLLWLLDAQPVLENAHDPTALQIENTIYLYVDYMTTNVLVLESDDGATFTPSAWVEFYGENGQRIEGVGDADIFDTLDGQLLLYASGQGTNGVAVFRQAER